MEQNKYFNSSCLCAQDIHRSRFEWHLGTTNHLFEAADKVWHIWQGDRYELWELVNKTSPHFQNSLLTKKHPARIRQQTQERKLIFVTCYKQFIEIVSDNQIWTRKHISNLTRVNVEGRMCEKCFVAIGNSKWDKSKKFKKNWVRAAEITPRIELVDLPSLRDLGLGTKRGNSWTTSASPSEKVSCYSTKGLDQACTVFCYSYTGTHQDSYEILTFKQTLFRSKVWLSY